MKLPIIKFVPGRGLVIADLYNHVVKDTSVFEEVSGIHTIKLSDGNARNLLITGDTQINIEVNPNGEEYQHFLLLLTQDSVGNHIVTINAPIQWLQEIPNINTDPDAESILAFFTLDKGASFLTTYVEVANE